MRKRFIKDLLAYSPSRIVPLIVAIALLPVLTRLFSPSEYGIYALLVTAITFLTAVSSWIRISIIRFYSRFKNEKKLEGFYKGVIKYFLATTALLFGSSLAVYYLFLRDKFSIDNVLFTLVILVFILGSLTGLLRMILRVQYKIKLFSLFSIWSAIVPRLSGVACVLLFSTGIEGLFIGRIFAVVITIPILWKLCFNKLNVFSEKVPDKLFYTMGTYGFPIVISSLAAWFLRLSDRYLIAFFKSSYEVGLYSVSYHISEKSIAIIIALFLLADRPIAMELWESSKSDEQKVKVKSFLTATSRYFLLMAIPVCFGIWAIGKQVVSILVASDYHEGYVILPFVVFGLFLSGVANRYQLPILFYKKTKFIMINTLIAGTLNVILNIIFIPKYGYFAAAVTTLISYISYLTITVCFSRGLFKWPFPLKSLIRISAASAIMFVCVRLFLNLTDLRIIFEVLFSVVLGIAIYIFFIFIFGEISASEKQELFKIAKSTFKIRKR